MHVDEIRPLTSLRMIAALMVFVHHFGPFPYFVKATMVWESVIIEGHSGVTIFFVLSGFLITTRYYESITSGAMKLKDYFIKRIARIYPLYFFLLGLTLLFTHGTLFPAGSVLNWTLALGFFSRAPVAGMAVAWSLTVEECFYLLAPIVYMSVLALTRAKWTSKWNRIVVVVLALAVWTAGLYAVGYAISSLVRSSHMGIPLWGLMEGRLRLNYFSIFGRFFDFAVGISAAFIFMSGKITQAWSQPYGRWLAAAGMALAIAGIILGEHLMNQSGGNQYGIWGFNYLIAVSSGLWILTLTCPDTLVARFLSLNLFVYLGRVSYALYLSQVLIYRALLIEALNHDHWMYLIIMFVMMNCISALLYEVIERPAQKAILWIAGRAPNLFRRATAESAENVT